MEPSWKNGSLFEHPIGSKIPLEDKSTHGDINSATKDGEVGHPVYILYSTPITRIKL